MHDSIDSRSTLQRVRRALILVIACSLVLAVGSIAASLRAGDTTVTALRSSSLLGASKLVSATGMDSWAAMWSGLARLREQQGSPYERTWLLDKCKFQYPPSALLMLELMPEPDALPMSCAPKSERPNAWTDEWSARTWISRLSGLCVFVTAGVAVMVLRRELPLSPNWGSTSALAALFIALTFFPMWQGHKLGQVQVLMNLGLAVALLVVRSRPVLAGVLVGLCCLLKPQYVLFALWGALRREGRFCAGLLVTFGAGTALALAVYGLDVHLQYVAFLRGLSQTGEVFWANQTLNGVLNRWLGTGDPVNWIPGAFPTYHPVVRWGTLLGAVPLLAAALWLAPRQVAGTRRDLDFGAMLAALTIASPVGWDHHYGSFIVLFALLLGVTASRANAPRAAWLVLGFAFVAMANEWLAPQHLFNRAVGYVLGSHLWLGALATLGLLCFWRQRTGTLEAQRPSATSATVGESCAAQQPITTD